MTEPVIYSVVDGIAWITMNRPAARNALNKAVREGLEDAFARAEGDDSAAVVVLTGAGDKAFCSGGDLKEMAENSLGVPPPDYVPQPNRTIEMTKPLIAAVNGHAFAGGFLLMQSADLVVVADHARLGITEAVVGRGAPWAVPLPWLIPPRVAMQMLLTGEPISAARAFEVGLVNEVVPAAELVGATTRLARRIASNAPLSVRAGKATVYAAARECRDQAFESLRSSGRRSISVRMHKRGPEPSPRNAHRSGSADEQGGRRRRPRRGPGRGSGVADGDRGIDLGGAVALPTPAPTWTIHDQIAHLANFDALTRLALDSPDEFARFRDSCPICRNTSMESDRRMPV